MKHPRLRRVVGLSMTVSTAVWAPNGAKLGSDPRAGKGEGGVSTLATHIHRFSRVMREPGSFPVAALHLDGGCVSGLRLIVPPMTPLALPLIPAGPGVAREAMTEREKS